MTQTAKTILGGIGVLVLVLALVAVANKNLNINLEQQADTATSTGPTTTPEASIDHPDNATTSSSTSGTISTPTRQASACRNAEGTWDGEHGECSGLSEGSCTQAGGTWNDCASPCRNDPTATACIQSCVQVCTIK